MRGIGFLTVTIYMVLSASVGWTVEPLRLGLPPDASDNTRAAAERFAAVAADTDGAPSIVIVTLRDETADAAVGDGTVDLAIVPLDRYADRVPALDLFSIPYLLQTDAQRQEAMKPDGGLRVSLDSATVNFGARILALVPNGWQGLAYRGDPPVRPDALAGQRVMVTAGAAKAGFVAAPNGRPVLRGRHDIRLAAPAQLAETDQAQGYDGFVVTAHGRSELALIIHQDTYVSLSDRDAEALREAAHVLETEWANTGVDIDRKALDALAAAGWAIHRLESVEQENWRSATSGLARSYYLGESGRLGRAFLRLVDRMQGPEDVD